MVPPLLTRRRLLWAGLGSSATLFAEPGFAAPLFAEDMGLVPNIDADQSETLQGAIDKAALAGRRLSLPAGRYFVHDLNLPAGLYLQGVRGATRLVGAGDTPIARGGGADNLTLSGLIFDGDKKGPDGDSDGLVVLEACDNAVISDCGFVNGAGNGLHLHLTSGRVEACRFAGLAETALFAHDSAGLILSGNTIRACGNGGIRVFRSKKGPDGTIVTNNQITGIASQSGNGQNGNGINVFRAGNVVVSDNVVADCDFSAVRLNATDDCQVSGNNCRDCREVAIFSEFGFSGSSIIGNIIAGAATGISITNLDDGGRLAVCANNLVRDITANSPTNPDTRPVGILAEGDCAITGNTIDTVPGVGILAGWGAFLRNILVADNVILNTVYGIGASVAKGAGQARITGNLISNAKARAISGFAWYDPKGGELAGGANPFKNLTVSGNTVSRS